MVELIEIIVQYVSIWAPSLVAMLGVVATVCVAIAKTKTALNALKTDTTLKELKDELQQAISQNAELVKCNKLLLDEITKIKGYANSKER